METLTIYVPVPMLRVSLRIFSVQVYAGEQLCGTIEYNAEVLTYDVDCGGVVASSVKVNNPTTHLTLCEVRFYEVRKNHYRSNQN